MVKATTFAEFVEAPQRDDTFLIEITAGEHLVGFGAVSGLPNTYSLTYLEEIIPLADGLNDVMHKVIEEIREDGITIYTSVGATLTVDSTASSFFHDTPNKTLYVHTSTGATPSDFTLVGFFDVFFSNRGVIFNDRYYLPIVRDVPNITERTQSIFFGTQVTGAGDLVLNNSGGHLDKIFNKYLWENKEVRFRVGGDELPFSEYVTAAVLVVQDRDLNEDRVRFNLTDVKTFLRKDLPPNVFDTTTSPSLEDGAEGRPIPIYYGTYSDDNAPKVTATTVGTTNAIFKLCDHPIRSFDTFIYNGIVTTTVSAQDTTNATFQLDVPYDVDNDEMRVAFKGRTTDGVAGSTVMDAGPDIVEDILIAWVGFTASDLNTVVFTQSRSDAEFILRVPLQNDRVTVNDIIEKIGLSEFSFFYVDPEGTISYRIFTPILGSDRPQFDDNDYLDFKVATREEDILAEVLVKYDFNPFTAKSLQISELNLPSQFKYEKKDSLTLDTYLTTKSDAETLGQKYNTISKSPTQRFTFNTSFRALKDITIGTKIDMTKDRAPEGSARRFDSKVVEVLTIKKNFSRGMVSLEADDLKGIGASVGIWTLDSAPTYTAASTAERNLSGFWLNDADLADSADPFSSLVSTWF